MSDRKWKLVLPDIPDSSKDLEKDEREAMRRIYMSLRTQQNRHRSWVFECFKEGWCAKGEQAAARLQQIEADVEDLVNTLQRLLSVCEGGEYQPQRVEDGARDLLDRHGKLDVEQAKDYEGRLAQYEAELSIAREALGAADYLIDRLNKVTERISVRDLDEAQAAYNKTLARLQAKEEGT